MFAFILTAAAGDRPFDITAADLNGDGFLDLAVANFPVDPFGFGAISVLFNDGTGLFEPPVELRANQLPVSIAAADVSGDGAPDLIVGNKFSGDVSVLINNGDGTFSDPFSSAAGDMVESVITADLDADGDLDIAAASLESRSISILLNLGEGIFAPELFFALEHAPRSVAAGDVDGDGRLDLIVASEEQNTISVLLNNGVGTSQPSSLSARTVVRSARSRRTTSLRDRETYTHAPPLCLTCRDGGTSGQDPLNWTGVRNILKREAK